VGGDGYFLFLSLSLSLARSLARSLPFSLSLSLCVRAPVSEYVVSEYVNECTPANIRKPLSLELKLASPCP
jgi:hypothetical protein